MAAPEELLRRRLREISTKWPRWGFRRAHATLRMEGWKVNHKRVQRLWRDEGLRVPAQSPKRRRLGQSTVSADRLRAERPNQVWALDFMFDTTSDPDIATNHQEGVVAVAAGPGGAVGVG
ncbi:MAG: IS3 family transposase [Candidatus Dormibacteria bacterium]